jgi:hypothetical protein
VAVDLLLRLSAQRRPTTSSSVVSRICAVAAYTPDRALAGHVRDEY